MDSHAETFFDQMVECMRKDAAAHPGGVSKESMTALLASTQPPGFTPPNPFVTEKKEENKPLPAAVAPVPETVAAVPEKDSTAIMEEMRLFALNCKRCPLASTRTNVVFGEGNPHARLMFIGEGPGADEDRLGRPFVGKAGQLLDKMIAAMNFSREEVYIANIVKCRPPNNRVPETAEVERCIGFLHRQIKFIKPEVIVLLGATATRFLLNQEGNISRLRGTWLAYNGIPVMPTFHPAYLLRQESAKRDAWSDLKQVMAKLGKSPR